MTPKRGRPSLGHAGHAGRRDRCLACRLRELREAGGWTQTELARELRRSLRTVQGWERGEVPVDPAALRLLELLRVS